MSWCVRGLLPSGLKRRQPNGRRRLMRWFAKLVELVFAGFRFIHIRDRAAHLIERRSAMRFFKHLVGNVQVIVYL
jgi:hypothetical protein